MTWETAGHVATVFMACCVPCAALGWYFRAALLQNNETLLTKINGTYVKKEVLLEWRASVDRRLDAVEGVTPKR